MLVFGEEIVEHAQSRLQVQVDDIYKKKKKGNN